MRSPYKSIYNSSFLSLVSRSSTIPFSFSLSYHKMEVSARAFSRMVLVTAAEMTRMFAVLIASVTLIFEQNISMHTKAGRTTQIDLQGIYGKIGPVDARVDKPKQNVPDRIYHAGSAYVVVVKVLERNEGQFDTKRIDFV